MEPLVEVVTSQELELALGVHAKVIGVNNRDLDHETHDEVTWSDVKWLQVSDPKWISWKCHSHTDQKEKMLTIFNLYHGRGLEGDILYIDCSNLFWCWPFFRPLELLDINYNILQQTI